MTWRDRILHDGIDREGWLVARHPVIGASDASGLAKATSVDKYLLAKLTDRHFSGNSYTASGHRWEPMMLAYAGITENKALIHAPDNRGFAATPDGADETRGAECKAKHNKVVFGPSLGEWRQVAWQFLCVPEFEEIEWLWVELINDEMRADHHGEPKHLTIRRNDNKVNDLITQMLPIATDLLAQLTAALAFEKEMQS